VGGTGVKVHLGCGNVRIPGFIHIDQMPTDATDYVAAVDNLYMLADGCASLIYASHVLEYFDRNEAVRILREWRRALEWGGTLRLAVPNLPDLMWWYQQGHPIESILGPLYGRLRTDRGYIYHRTCYDLDSLEALLRKCGFDRVRNWNWRTTEHADIDDCSQAYMPHMDKAEGMLISLNLEADKV